ncbi:MAG TPA: protein kinase [Thermoanaerobaculia bacterium]|nr:protein kinase [Thermoanaerobaculia bacterium]
MTLRTGAHLGPFEIVGPLGAGGMGVVYRARDSRLGREVAIKVLPEQLSWDRDRLARFQREAQVLAQLNHPAICSIFGIEAAEGVHALVLELVEGPTLEEKIASGPIPLEEAIPIARDIASALEAAHEKGIVHRDLKPANVKLTAGGHAKVLDFGLAKALGPASGSPSHGPTGPVGASPQTEPGLVVGTAAYMSPEQARGLQVDRRTDVWSFGVLLYEMLTGRKLFDAATPMDVLLAVVSSEVDLTPLPPKTPAALRELLARCLRHDVRTRLQDIGHARVVLGELSAPGALAAAMKKESRRASTAGRGGIPRSAFFAVLAVAVAAVVALAILAFRPTRRPTPPAYWQLTFRRGTIHAARFTPTGDAAVYSAGWEGRPVEVFESRRGSPETRPLLERPASILSISSSGEMAVLLLTGRTFARGTLARASLSGGAPREVLESTEWADWMPGGEKLAVVRSIPGGRRLEMPIGKTIAETRGWLSHPRVTSSGDAVAFLLHPVPGDNGGSVEISDAGGQRTLSGGWKAVWGLAFSPRGDEVLFSASERETARSIWAVDLEGRKRLVAALPLRMTLQDVARDGTMLLTHDLLRRSTFVVAPGETRERDLSWLDYSNAKDLSDDGKTLLFSEDGEGGGANYAVYTRGTDGSPAVRLGDGKATSLSPDGLWALAIRVEPDRTHRLVAHPTGPGERRLLPHGSLTRLDWATFLPDGRRVLVAGAEKGQPVRLYLQDFDGRTPPRAVGGDGISAIYGAIAVSPDGSVVAAPGKEDRIRLYRLDGGPEELLAGAEPREVPIRFSPDGRFVWVFQPRDLPTWIVRIDRTTGARERWKEIQPPDPAGILGITRVRMTPDGRSYAYTFSRILSDLFLAKGLL